MDDFQENHYLKVFNELREKIRLSRMRAIFSVNNELLKTYWEIGNAILGQQKEQGWGSKVIDRLSVDLKIEFPNFRGVSARNLKYMRAFAEAYPDFGIVQTSTAQNKIADNQPIVFVQSLVAQISWSSHIVLLEKIKTPKERSFYMQKAVENGWSKSVLSMQIESKLYARQGAAISNFKDTLPATTSDLVQETFKNPYIFDFITLHDEVREKDIERALIRHLKKFMLELGRGFAYVGNQYNLDVEGNDFFLDLLFYNFHLHCFVTFELKVGDFKPEFAGKLNFYINAIDANIKGPKDNPTIGILLCKTPSETVVKYSLQGIATPMGVAEYKLEQSLPPQLKGEIPTIEELEKEIEREYEELKSPVDKKFERIKNLLSGISTEPIKEKRSSEKCIDILTKILFPLKATLSDSLSETIFEFEESTWTYSIENVYRNSERDAMSELEGKKIVGRMELQLRLTGMKKAGTKTFNIWESIYVELQEYYYKIGKEQFPKEPWYENVYHILPTAKQLAEIEEKFKEEVYDKITQNLERINR